MNYLALILPVTAGYIAHYYLMKHEYRELQIEYKTLHIKHKRLLSKNGENNE
jgi:hypothetical protein